ncbi:MAG: O-antigen ligase family protein [Polyangiaceae bacterium]|nr:O-antigen ligase family protein [Polyangiaceae bacterium]
MSLWGRQAEARGSAPVLVLSLFALWTLLQTIPLPLAILTKLAPWNAAVWAGAWVPFGQELRWGSISLEPGQGRKESLLLLAYASIFVLAPFIRGEWGRRRMLVSILVACVFLYFITVAHTVGGFEKVYGIYRPRFQSDSFQVGPLLNPNNRGGVYNLGVFLALGLATSFRGPKKGLCLLGAFTLGVGVLFTASRGAASCLFLGIGLWLWLSFGSGVRLIGLSRRSFWYRGLGALGILVLVPLTFLLLVRDEVVLELLFDLDATKLEFWKKMWAALPSFLGTGVGKGAFGTASQSFLSLSRDAIYEHAENFAFEWVFSWGLIPGVLAIFSWLYFLRPNLWLGAEADEISRAVWVGLSAWTLQNLVDLATEVPGVAALALGIAAIARPRLSLGSDLASRKPRWFWRSSSDALALTVLTLGAGAYFLTQDGGQRLSFDRQRVANLALESLEPEAALRLRDEVVKPAMKLHPADAYYARVAGYLSLMADREALPFVTRALRLAPAAARTRLLASRTLAAEAPRQALALARDAGIRDPQLATVAARQMLAITRSASELELEVPLGPAGARFLFILAAEAGALGESELQYSLLRGVDLRDPNDPAALSQLIAQELARADTVNCSACLQRVRTWLERLERSAEHRPLAGIYRMKMAELLQAGSVEWFELEVLCSRASRYQPNCGRFWLNLARQRGSFAQMDRAARFVTTLGCFSLSQCAENADLVASQYRLLHAPEASLLWAQKAAEFEPNFERWQTVLQLATQLERSGTEALARQKMEIFRPAEPAATAD